MLAQTTCGTNAIGTLNHTPKETLKEIITKSHYKNMNLRQKIKSFLKNDNPQAQIKWSLYSRVWWELGRPYWKLLLLGVICTLIAAGAEAFSITLVKKVIDQGFIEKNMDYLYLIGIQVVVVYFVKGFFTYGKVVSMAKAGLLGSSYLRQRMY